MKARIVIFTLLISAQAVCSGQARSMFGMDIAGMACFRQARITAGYAFLERWSADADISLHFKGISDRWDKEEQEHWNTLYGYEEHEDKLREDFTEYSISFCYWPSGCYSGAMLCAGGSIRDRSGPDFTFGFGYWCRISKKFRAGFMYRIMLVEYLKKGQMPADGLRINIGYAF